MSVSIPAHILIGGVKYPVTISNISRFGAFVTDLPHVAAGTDVELVLMGQGPGSLRIASRLVYWMNAATAKRLGTMPGAGLQYHEPIQAEDTAFGAAITCLIVQQRLTVSQKPGARAGRPTARMPEAEQDALITAMTVGTPELDGHLVFAGNLETIGLAEILMALARMRRGGRLEIARGEIVATLDLSCGDILDVRSSIDVIDPKALLFRLLAWHTGTFRLFATTPHATQARRFSISKLLLEHLRAGRTPVHANMAVHP